MRALVLLPGSNIVAELDLLEGSSLFKCRRDPCEFALRRKNQREQSLAKSPLRVCEVLQAAAAGQKDSVDSRVAHVTARGFLPVEVLVTRDRPGLARHWFDRRVLLCNRGLLVNGKRERRQRAEFYKVSSIDCHLGCPGAQASQPASSCINCDFVSGSPPGRQGCLRSQEAGCLRSQGTLDAQRILACFK